MTCIRTPIHEETELLTVLKFPFRVRTLWRPRLATGWVLGFVALVMIGWDREVNGPAIWGWEGSGVG
jgi:hypothetical protein